MFLRHGNPPLSEADVRRLAAEMVAEFGEGRFWIDRAGERDLIPGLTPPAGHHALWIAPSLGQLRAMASHPLYGGPNKKQFAALRNADEGAPVWMAPDGAPIVGGPDEQFIGVELTSRYYGFNWGSGDWPFLRALMDWLEDRVRGAAIWYGGDWGDTGIHLTTPGDRQRLEAHYRKTEDEPRSEPYRVETALRLGRPTERLCEFCAGRPMHHVLFARSGVEEYWCSGCEAREAIVSESGKVYLAPVRTDDSRPFDLAGRRFRSLDDADTPWKTSR